MIDRIVDRVVDTVQINITSHREVAIGPQKPDKTKVSIGLDSMISPSPIEHLPVVIPLFGCCGLLLAEFRLRRLLC